MTATLHSWSPPPGPSTVALAAGVRWDAIRAPIHLGLVVVETLGDLCGSVIGDPYGCRYYWLIPPGSAVDWGSLPVGAEVQHLSVACWVTVPPRERRTPPGPHWVLPYREGVGYLTDPDRLHAALAHAVAITHGSQEGRADGRG